METLTQLEHACSSDNHEQIKSLLSSIESVDLKKEAFSKILLHYESKSLLPVGYILWFIQYLIMNRDYSSAMEQIKKSRRIGIHDDRLSQLVYENFIRPEESFYRERFNRNLRLLQENKILFSDQEIDFEQIKKQILIIADLQPEIPDDVIKRFNGRKTLLVDVMNLKVIENVLNNAGSVCLVYDDIKIFYSMLLLEDFHTISSFIKQQKIVLFPGGDINVITDFFMNLLILPPRFCFGLPGYEKYSELTDEINEMRLANVNALSATLNDIYKNHDYQYYRNLLAGRTSDTKIMLITSEKTELNKFVARNWQEAFSALGYQVKLLIESNSYEDMNNYYVYYSMKEFKPDIIFHINFTVNEALGIDDGAVRNNSLWIVRYRDTAGNELHRAQDGYDCKNMFIFPIFQEWGENLMKVGVPENRILTIAEGVNINVFKKREKPDSRYACDIVIVNNAVGSETFRLDYYLNQVKQDNLKKAIYEVVEMMEETVNKHEETIFLLPDIENIISMLKKRMLEYGMHLRENFDASIISLFEHIRDSLSRGKISEWIVDSGITGNIKLWGKGWSNIDKFRKYHAGMAGHGDELAAIYRSSKISISDSHWALHERNFEILASGGFPLIRYVKFPEVEKVNEITHHFDENKEIVMFYSKDDLLNKIQHYLDNPEERELIAERGRQVVLKSFSHIAIAKKAMGFITDYYRD